MRTIKEYDPQLLEEMLKTRMLSRNLSPDGKLMKFNYSNKCIYEKKWNKITLTLRGHTFDVTSGEIVATAFPKFFNLFEYGAEKQEELTKKKIYKVYEKLDGVLILIYFYEGEWRLETRGKFDTPMALKARKLLKEKYDLSSVNKNYTLLTELLTQDFKIVIDYGTEERLVLLSAYDKSTSKELRENEVRTLSEETHFPVTKCYDYTIEQMSHLIEIETLNGEGFVIRFEDDFRLKMKSQKYMNLAFLLSHLTPLGFWRNMRNGKVRKDVLVLIPEEYREKTDKMVARLEAQYEGEKIERFNDYYQLIKGINKETRLSEDSALFRKEMGLRINNLKYKDSVFLIKDQKWKKLDLLLIQKIRPKSNEFSD